MKIKTILVSQPAPKANQSPYFDLMNKQKVKIDFRSFIHVEGVTARDVRDQKIDFLDFSAVIFTSRNAVDNYFRLAEELRISVPDDMKYFCLSEAVAFYLQKYVVYRKRKIYVGTRTFDELLPLIKKVNSSLEPNQMIKLLNYIDSFPKDNQERAFNSIIKHMPSLRNEVDLLSIVQLDRNRKITMNDFFDLENIPIPLAYSKYFVARDKWIRHLFNSTNLPEINDCEYFYDLNELLNSLTNSYLK